MPNPTMYFVVTVYKTNIPTNDVEIFFVQFIVLLSININYNYVPNNQKF